MNKLFSIEEEDDIPRIKNWPSPRGNTELVAGKIGEGFTANTEVSVWT